MTSVDRSRRAFLQGAASSAAIAAGLAHSAKAVSAQTTAIGRAKPLAFDLQSSPSAVTVFAGLRSSYALSRQGATWAAGDLVVEIEATTAGLSIYLEAPQTKPTHVRLRWNQRPPSGMLILGDAWERSYGDLGWRTLVPERVMPWYFLAYESGALHGYGVKTGARSLCFWLVDSEGVTLWMNVANGGDGVVLGQRRLHAATVVTGRTDASASPLLAARAFCQQMCDKPRQAGSPIYGSNDWYYAYGQNTAEQTLRDADLIASCAPARGARPFTIIDDGWRRADAFPEMQTLAQKIRSKGVRPGIWIRPLQAAQSDRAEILLSGSRYGSIQNRYRDLAYDPTTEAGLNATLDKVTQVVDWGFELVKHDYSTYELLGRWGSEMGAQPTSPGWHFHDQSKTTAEIILELYEAIRKAAGDKTILLGCNTIGHLSAGIFDAQRTGDDVSGKLWERTRRMGINTLAFRLPQHKSFFLQDADCAPITRDIPWRMTKQWLDLLARSGTTCLISPEPQAISPERKSAIRESFAIVASEAVRSTPLNWFDSTTPDRWNAEEKASQEGRLNEKLYLWNEDSGAWPIELG